MRAHGGRCDMDEDGAEGGARRPVLMEAPRGSSVIRLCEAHGPEWFRDEVPREGPEARRPNAATGDRN